jgi:hypothetical protein
MAMKDSLLPFRQRYRRFEELRLLRLRSIEVLLVVILASFSFGLTVQVVFDEVVHGLRALDLT